jgi:ankyrin repeat protein
MVGLLLQNGADIPEWTGRVLGDAAQWGNKNVLKLLLKTGADCNMALPWKGGRSPLSVAVEGGHIKVMELLLDSGADVDARTETGRDPLSWATYCWTPTATEILLDWNANVGSKDNNSRTPLSWAAQYGNQLGIKLLLARGASSMERDRAGLPPIHYAKEHNNLKVIGLLFEKGARSDLSDHERKDIETDAEHGDRSRMYDQEWMAARVPRALEQIVMARRKRWVSQPDDSRTENFGILDI